MNSKPRPTRCPLLPIGSLLLRYTHTQVENRGQYLPPSTLERYGGPYHREARKCESMLDIQALCKTLNDGNVGQGHPAERLVGDSEILARFADFIKD